MGLSVPKVSEIQVKEGSERKSAIREPGKLFFFSPQVNDLSICSLLFMSDLKVSFATVFATTFSCFGINCCDYQPYY